MQSAANFLAVAFAISTGVLYDKYGSAIALLCSQFFGSLSSFILWYGSWGVSSNSIQADPYLVTFLVFGFVFRKSDRTYAALSSIITDETLNIGTREERLSKAAGLFGAGFALGPAIVGVLAKEYNLSIVFLFGCILCVVNVVSSLFVLSSVTQKRDTRVQLAKRHDSPTLMSQISSILLHADLIAILAVHAMSCFGQFCYISSVSLMVRDRFELDPTHFGYLLSFFGITYSLSMWILVPRLSAYLSEVSILAAGLFITGAMRVFNAQNTSLFRFYFAHAFIGIGTASISFVVTNIVTRKGRTYNITGSLVGAKDVVQRVTGFVSPLLISGLPTVSNGFYVGAVVSSLCYFGSFLIVFQGGRRVLNPSDTIHYKRLQGGKESSRKT